MRWGSDGGSRRALRLSHGAIVAAITFVTSPAYGEVFKLTDALALAYQTNPQIQEQRAALDALDQGVAQAQATGRPQINGSVSDGYDHVDIQGTPRPITQHPFIGQVAITQPIFRGGRIEAEVRRANAQVDAGRAQLQATEQAVLLAAVTAYMDVVRDTMIVQSNAQNVSSLESVRGGVETELRAGMVTRTDASQAVARLARARADAALAQTQLAASRAAFEDVIGRPPETLQSDVAPPPLPNSKDAALALALRDNPDILQAKANERAAKFEVADAVGALFPDISVSGQYQFLRGAANASPLGIGNQQQVASILALMNVPIYQGGGEEATVRRAKDTHRQSEFAIATTEHQVRQNLDSTWEALSGFQLAIQANREQAAADQGAVVSIQQERQAGERSVLDVLNAQQELFAAETGLATAEHDRIVAAYRVLALTGRLTARSLGLNVDVYDPQRHYDENANAWFGFGE